MSSWEISMGLLHFTTVVVCYSQGSYGILRSREGWSGERIVFSGFMTMIEVDTGWRMTWVKNGIDQFGFINEERLEGGAPGRSSTIGDLPVPFSSNLKKL